MWEKVFVDTIKKVDLKVYVDWPQKDNCDTNK